jgi:hypothetical protein
MPCQPEAFSILGQRTVPPQATGAYRRTDSRQPQAALRPRDGDTPLAVRLATRLGIMNRAFRLMQCGVDVSKRAVA